MMKSKIPMKLLYSRKGIENKKQETANPRNK